MSLKAALGHEYKLVASLNAGILVSAFFQDYLGDTLESFGLPEEFNQRHLGEITPKNLKDNPGIWETPVLADKITPEILNGLADKDFKKVVKNTEPDYVIDPDHITLGMLARLANIQHLGMVHQLAHKKKDESKKFIEKLNCPKAYDRVRNGIASKFPEFRPYLSEENHQFSLGIYDKNIVKEVDSAWRKADDYECNNKNHGKAGIFGIMDPLRITFLPEIENPTWEQWVHMRNKIFAYALVGEINLDLTRVKDHVSKVMTDGNDNGYPWASCMFNGTQCHAIDDNAKNSMHVKLSWEAQLAPLSPKNEHYKKITADFRQDSRGGDEVAKLVQQGLIADMWERTLPNLCHAVEDNKSRKKNNKTNKNGKDDKPYDPDLSYIMITDHLSNTGQQYNSNIVDLTAANSLQDVKKNLKIQNALHQMTKQESRRFQYV
jgi:hypothetical protein